MNSMASNGQAIPPMPIIGIFTVLKQRHTASNAIGLIAGPLSPPVILASLNRRLRGSIAVPTTVLIMLSASAPASSQAFAMTRIFVTFGESLAMTGIWVTLRTAATTDAASSGSVA